MRRARCAAAARAAVVDAGALDGLHAGSTAADTAGAAAADDDDATDPTDAGAAGCVWGADFYTWPPGRGGGECGRYMEGGGEGGGGWGGLTNRAGGVWGRDEEAWAPQTAEAGPRQASHAWGLPAGGGAAWGPAPGEANATVPGSEGAAAADERAGGAAVVAGRRGGEGGGAAVGGGGTVLWGECGRASGTVERGRGERGRGGGSGAEADDAKAGEARSPLIDVGGGGKAPVMDGPDML